MGRRLLRCAGYGFSVTVAVVWTILPIYWTLKTALFSAG